MQIKTEEKKYALSVLGASCAACRILYPSILEKKKISDFYEALSENLMDFFKSEAEVHKEKYEKLPRKRGRVMEQLRMNLFFTVTFNDEKILSITREYVICLGKKLLNYRKDCEVWNLKEEILIHPKELFPRKARKTAENNEFFFDGDAVLVENLFPQTVGTDGRRIRLSDYVRETRFKKQTK